MDKTDETCEGDKCFSWVTYYYKDGKWLKNPIIRCISDKCHLDGLPTTEVNKQLEEDYPSIYVK